MKILIGGKTIFVRQNSILAQDIKDTLVEAAQRPQAIHLLSSKDYKERTKEFKSGGERGSGYALDEAHDAGEELRLHHRYKAYQHKNLAKTSKKIEDKKNHLLEAQKHLAKAKKIKSVMGDMRNSEDWNYG